LLKTRDVLMEVDGVPIANDGTFQFRTGERLSFSYLVSRRYVGEEIPLKILREGRPMHVNVPLCYINRLVPAYIRDDPPYFVVAGLVFTVLTEPYLQSEYGEDWVDDTPVGLMDRLLYGMQQVRASCPGSRYLYSDLRVMDKC